MLSRGIHPKVASEMLGHSNIAITLDLYSHVSATMQRDAARTMDEIGAPGPNMAGNVERMPEPPRAV